MNQLKHPTHDESEFARLYVTEGRHQGEVEGRADLVIRQLTLRFGRLPSEALSRISAASTKELNSLGVWLLTSQTLDEALDPHPGLPNYQYQSEFAKHYLAKGRLEGKLRGRADLVTRQLKRRFGRLPHDVLVRISIASTEELDAIGERLLTAHHLRETLSPLGVVVNGSLG